MFINVGYTEDWHKITRCKSDLFQIMVTAQIPLQGKDDKEELTIKSLHIFVKKV